MRKKNAVVSLLIAFAMLFTVFAFNVPEAEAAVNKNTYWIKVNTQCNVVTVYKKSGSEYKPVRAMVCSCGKKGSATPTGTYRMGTKIGWCYLVGNVWGRYSMVIKGNYLFHSVPYSKKSINSMKYNEYNKLGTNCSHGCVRLALMDAKWIWNKCPKGTKITVYKSKDPGPLGKPIPIKMKSSWKYDPTDPSKNNPNFKLKKPVISISSSKPKTVEKGTSYSIKSGVTGKNPNANQNLSYYVKVYKTYKYSTSKKKYVKSDFTTKKTGKYKITYKLYSYYCGGTTYKSFYVNVIEPETITIKTPNRSVILGTDNAVNAVLDVTAKQKSSNRTTKMAVSILEPGATKAKQLSYTSAKKYKFKKAGKYKVTYSVKNYYYPYKKKSKTVYISCISPGTLTIKADDREVILGTDNAVNAVLGATAEQKNFVMTSKMSVSIVEPGASKAKVLSYTDAEKYVFKKVGKYKITYSVKNYYYPYKKKTKTIYVTCIEPEPVNPEQPVVPDEPQVPEVSTDPVEPTESDTPDILEDSILNKKENNDEFYESII